MKKKKIHGYGLGKVDTVLSVDEIERRAAALAPSGPTPQQLDTLAGPKPMVVIDQLVAGYGKMEILHKVNLRVGRGQSLCLIGPNGAGKSTILHSIFGFSKIFSGKILVNEQDVTEKSPSEKLKNGISYVLQDNSVFPGMTVEENLWMGGFLLNKPTRAKEEVEKIFEKYGSLRERRKAKAGSLSGGERRLLEISRALIMNPDVLLIDEPSIGLEPRFIDMVFDILGDLQHNEGKTIILVEQNAKKGLEFADLAYVLVAGNVAIAGTGKELLKHEGVGKLFLGD